jgi:hypothetical protein
VDDRLTDADLMALAFIAEHPLVLPAHVAALLGTSVATAAKRLGKLGDAGFLRHDGVFRGEPDWHQITRRGASAVASGLAPPRAPDLSHYQHDVGVAWLWLAARAGTFGPLDAVIGERRMRAHDAALERGTEPLGVRLGGVGPRGKECLHHPDLLLRTADGRRIALELELSPKSRTRLEKILAGYGADPRFDGVVYLVERPAIARSIEAAARRVGVSDLVRVQRVRGSARNGRASRAIARGHSLTPGTALARRDATRSGRAIEAGR